MRRLVALPVLLLGFACAVAMGSTDGHATHTVKALSGTGTIKKLGLTTIGVRSAFDISCRLTSTSPALDAFAVGDHVRFVCADGVLVRIKPTTTTTPLLSTDTTTAAPAMTTASSAGAITALGTGAITVTGDRALTCTVGGASPSLGDYRVGDHVKIGCVNGVLYVVARIDSLPTATSTTGHGDGDRSTTTPSTAGATGTVAALSSSSITVNGEHSLTCSIGTSSPATGGFHLGDPVKIGCLNGALYYIVKATTTPAASTTTTTTTPTTTAATNTYGFGTIAALSSTTIAVTGDRPLSCGLASSSPRLGDYHVGDHVKMACQNSVLVGIVKDVTTTTTTTTATTTTTPQTTTTSANTYGVGTITALSATSVTVTGDRTATCSIAAGGPSPADYHLAVGSHLTMACTNGVVTHISV